MNRFCSIFRQLLQLFSRTDFQLAVKETRAERHARGFRSNPILLPPIREDLLFLGGKYKY
jgi:hypothetical protein